MKNFNFNLKRVIYFSAAVIMLFGFSGIVEATRSDPISYEVFSKFKNLMMYFNDHLLVDAKSNDLFFRNTTGNVIKGESFEGSYDTEAAKALYEVISEASAATDDAKKFKDYLKIGTDFIDKIVKNANCSDFTESKKLQAYLIKCFETTAKIVFPFHWGGSGPHAIGLIIEKNSDKSYNLVVVNTGAGLQYHYSQADPNNIYPWIKRLWIKFKNIPADVLFSEDSWFLIVFFIMKNESELKNIESEADSIPSYFYQSILSNFKHYAVPVDETDFKKLTPEQRSGSCTMSSLLASYLYLATDEKTYHYNRVVIGHTMLEIFLKKNDKNENFKKDFKKLITDGFDLVPRNLFKSTASSMAQQTLELLEKSFPKVFKHAGLLGVERSSWIKTKKDLAIQELGKQNNKESLNLVRKTVDLGLRIHEIFNDNPIDNKTNRIEITENLRKSDLNNFVFSFSQEDFSGDFGSSKLIENLSVKIERPIKIATNYVSLYATLSECCSDRSKQGLDSSNQIYCVLDTFRNSSHKNWWSYLDEGIGQYQALEFLKLCQDLIFNYTNSASTPNSLDDMIALSHLLIGAWKSAVIYDNGVIEDEIKVKLGLKNFKPPLVIENIIKEAGSILLTSGECPNWPIRNNFSAANLKELEFLRKAYSELTSITGNEHYFGPVEFLSKNRRSDTCYTSETLELIEKTKLSNEMYQKLWNNTKIMEKINAKKKSLADLSKNKKWNSESFAKLSILLGDSYSFVENIPHYYYLLNSMTWIYTRANLAPKKCSEKHSFETVYYIIGMAKINCRTNVNYDIIAKFNFYNGQNVSSTASPERCLDLKIQNPIELFHRLRHSSAFQNNNTIINFESWLNYLKGAQDLTMFESPYYLYISDRILNMPRLKLNKKNEIELRNAKIYPQGFDKVHIREVFENIFRLINVDLNFIKKKNREIGPLVKTSLILRSVNLAITLVRFIGRIDHDKVISAKSAAVMLANIYMKFYKFSPLKSEYGLGDLDISTVNLVLAQICDIPIRNPVSFLDKIKTMFKDDTNFNNSKMKLYRKSLARVHWFITKKHYAANNIGKSQSDDLFNLGFVYYQVALAEHPFMFFLLKELVLTRYSEKSAWNSIKVFNNGDIAKMESKSFPKITIFIQLSSGTIVKNGNLQVEKQIVINDLTFKKYFENESDRRYACQGEITRIGSTIIYLVKDYKFKSNTIVLLCKSGPCKVFRKTKNYWYQWIEADNNSFLAGINYKLVYDHRLYARSIEKSDNIETVLIKDDQIQPLTIISFDLEKSLIPGSFCLTTKSIKIYIGEFNDDSTWKIIKPTANDEKHLASFAQEKLIAKQEGSDQIVFIYPGLRLREDPERPLTLLERSADLPDLAKNENEREKFKVMNVDKLIIEENQVAIELPRIKGVYQGIGIKGTLIARNLKDDQRFILAPLNPNKNEPSFIERIPIVDGLPVPQTRLQRILLAFFCIKAREYNLARELLHPFTSINQNEVFSVKELEVFESIIGISGGGPEATALKLIVSMFKSVNRDKFPLEYVNDGKIETTEAAERVKRHKLLGSISEDLTLDYLFSVRDISEKYYIYRLFPEFLDTEIFLRNGFSLNNAIAAAHINYTVSSYQSQSYYYQSNYNHVSLPAKLSVHKISELEVKNLINSLNIDNFEKHKTFFSEYLSILSKLIVRQKKGTYQSRHNEMFIYCLKHDNTKLIFKPVADELYADLADTTCPDKKRQYNHKAYFDKAISKCFVQYSKAFEAYNFGINSKSTNINLIKKTFLADIKDINFGTYQETNDLQLIKHDDFIAFDTLAKGLDKIMTAVHENVELQFSNENLRSNVLKKLKGSIEKFIKEKGRYPQLELSFTKNQSDFSAFRFYLEGRIYEIRKELDEMLDVLMIETGGKDFNFNKTSSHSIEALTKLKHQRKLKQFSSLYSCYQKQSISCIQSKFTQLSQEECGKLLKNTTKFYSNEVLFEYLKMLLELIERFVKLTGKDQKIPVDDVALFMDEMKKIKSFDLRLKYPVILNFEYRSKRYRLRSEQVKDIDLLTSINSETKMFKSSVIQRMMAAGKTLVLGTISVVTKALDSTKLSILVPPSSLYQSNLSAMQARTYSFFKTKGHNFIFPRFQFSTEEELNGTLIPFLQSITKNIEKIMASKEYYVLSPDSLQAFLNSYIEVLNYYTKVVQTPKNKENGKGKDIDILGLEKALELFATIYDIFRTKGSIILDEIDMTMDPKKELNFPTIDNEPFNMLAAILTTDLIEFSVFDKEVKNIGLDILGNNQSSLTEDNYDKYRGKLIQYIGNQLDDSESLWSEKLLDANDNIVSKEKIIEFLKDPEIHFMKEWIEKLHEQKKKEIANALIIIKAQIYRNLKESLKGSANLNYGFTGPNRPNSEYSIPYLAANTPSPSSEFADRWETLNKTLLTFASVPCPKRIAKKMIKYLRNQVVEESTYKKQEKTTTYINVSILIRGLDIMSLNDKDEADVNLLHDALVKRSPAAIRLLFSYALDEIFDKMKFPVEQITSNALNITSMFGSVQGYSGTIDNVNILPREVVAGAYENHTQNEKNNGGISLKLISDSEDKEVFQLSDKTLELDIYEIIETIIKNVLTDQTRIEELSAIIDAGAFFKNFKNKQIAEAILENLKERIKVVLYYNEESNQVEFIRSTGPVGHISSTDPDSIYKATQVDISKRFTFYDQRHITGSDILQPKNARAIMTVGTRVLLRDILQGTLRMRQFMTSQKVHLVTSMSSCNFYFSKALPESDPSEYSKMPVKVRDILALGAFNEDEKQITENESLAFAKLDNELRRFVLEEITRIILDPTIKSKKSLDKIIPAWFDVSKKKGNRAKTVRDFFIRIIKESPLEWMVKHEKEDAHKVLKEYAESLILILKKISGKIKKIDPINKYNIDFLNDNNGLPYKSFITFKNTLEKMTSEVPNPKTAPNFESLLTFLPETITKRNASISNGNEVEMQVFTQHLAEIDLEKLIQVVQNNPTAADPPKYTLDPLVKNIFTAEIPSISADDYTIKLSDVLNDDNFTECFKLLVSSATLTSANRIGVTLDLLNLIKKPSPRPYLIFTKFTWEGTHFLIQALPNKKGLRIVLMSLEAADKTKELMVSKKIEGNGSTFWLCDLSGRVTETTDKHSTREMNVLDFIPASRVLIFDALVFNGSLDQILASKHLKELYKKWLRNTSFPYRAQFLLKRMMCLADKHKHMFAINDKNLVKLNRAAQGDKTVVNDLQTSFGLYKKPHVSEALAASFGTNNLTPSSSNALDPEEFYEAITGFTPSNSYPAEDFIKDFNPNKNYSIEDEKNSENIGDDSFLDVVVPIIKNWMDIDEDINDINKNAGEDLEFGIGDDDDETDDDEDLEIITSDSEVKIKSSEFAKPILLLIFGLIAAIIIIIFLNQYRAKKPEEQNSSEITEEYKYLEEKEVYDPNEQKYFEEVEHFPIQDENSVNDEMN